VTLGIALGCGGARGWAHIGVLRALSAAGIAPDVVAGCSMGALVGAAYAGGRLDALEAWARGLTRNRFLRYIDPRLRGGGLLGGAAVAELLDDLGLPDRIEALDRPFMAVASDLASGQEAWLQTGSLADAVRASVAIPGVLAPHCVEGRWLLDGGLTNPVPVSACRALGARRSIAVNALARHGAPLWSPDRADDAPLEAGATEGWPDAMRAWFGAPKDRPEAPRVTEVLNASIDMMMEFVRATRQAVDQPALLVAPHLHHIGVLELYRAEEAIEAGNAAGADAASRWVHRAQDAGT
jgi:NTE family protein